MARLARMCRKERIRLDEAKAYGVTVSTLTKTCRGVQKQTAGCRWAFIEEEVMSNDDRKREME